MGNTRNKTEWLVIDIIKGAIVGSIAYFIFIIVKMLLEDNLNFSWIWLGIVAVLGGFLFANWHQYIHYYLPKLFEWKQKNETK